MIFEKKKIDQMRLQSVQTSMIATLVHHPKLVITWL
jgi:hypothetical protein